jgi:hypothetical protein
MHALETRYRLMRPAGIAIVRRLQSTLFVDCATVATVGGSWRFRRPFMGIVRAGCRHFLLFVIIARMPAVNCELPVRFPPGVGAAV